MGEVLAAQSCLTLGNPMDCSPPGSSVHGILQARTLGWVAVPSSRGVFLTQGSKPGLLCLPHWQMVSLTTSATWEIPTKTQWSQINDKINFKGFPGGPVVKNLPFNAGGTCSILGQGTKILYIVGFLSQPTLEPMCHN